MTEIRLAEVSDLAMYFEHILRLEKESGPKLSAEKIMAECERALQSQNIGSDSVKEHGVEFVNVRGS